MVKERADVVHQEGGLFDRGEMTTAGHVRPPLDPIAALDETARHDGSASPGNMAMPVGTSMRTPGGSRSGAGSWADS